MTFYRLATIALVLILLAFAICGMIHGQGQGVYTVRLDRQPSAYLYLAVDLWHGRTYGIVGVNGTYREFGTLPGWYPVG